MGISLRTDNMGSSSSKSNISTFKLIGTIRAKPDFDPEESAKNIRKALKKTVGINEEAVIAEIIGCNNDQRQQMRKVYKGSFGEDLIDQLEKIKRTTLRKVLKALMRTPAEFAAHELNTAMKGIGTDESLMVEILCTRTNKEIEDIKTTYELLYKKHLEKAVKSELKGDIKKLLVALLQAQRAEDEIVNPEKAKEYAQELYKAGEGKIGTDETKFTFHFARRSWPMLKAMVIAYDDLPKSKTLEKAIKSECSGDLEKGYLTIIRLSSNPGNYYSKRINKAIKGIGTDEEQVIRHIVNTSEIALKTIDLEYQKNYKQDLTKAIKGDFSGAEKNILLAIVEGN